LIKALGESDGLLVGHAIGGLGDIGGPARKAIPQLLRILKAEKIYDNQLCKGAALALIKIREPFASMAPALIRAMDGEHQKVDTAIFKGLTKIGEPVIPYLVEALKDKRLLTRQRATGLLGRLAYDGHRKAQAVPVLVRMLKDPDAQLKRLVIMALGRYKDTSPSVLAALGRMLRDPSSGGDFIRKAAIALGRLGPATETTLSRALSAPHPWTRVYSCRALARLEPAARKSVPALIRLLNDPDEGVRSNAYDALDQIRKYAKDPVLSKRIKRALKGKKR